MAKSKKFFLFTGPPGIGKTFVVKKICNMLKVKNVATNGFYTEEVRESGLRTGFDVVSFDGKKSPLARISNFSKVRGPSVGKYIVDLTSFEEIALPLIRDNEGEVLVIDEIGWMELKSRKFTMKVEELTGCCSSILLATIPIEKRGNYPLLTTLRNHDKSQLIMVTKENRDTLANEVFKKIMELKDEKLDL